MIKRITKIGNSQGIVFDSTLMDLARLKVGDEVNVTVHEGGAIYLTPVRPTISPENVNQAIKGVMNDYAGTMAKLA